MEQSNVTRRHLLKSSLWLSGISSLFGVKSVLAEFREVCGLTPPQTEGPFYPENNQPDENNDLTHVEGKIGKPKGHVVIIEGIISDETCAPVKNGLVEIWQASSSGRYNHRLDTSGFELDPFFQYWGEVATNSQGEFHFKTIIPGHYPASSTWTRPPHIHVKVGAMGFHELTTQMYFDPKSFGNPEERKRVELLNSKDRILQAVPVGERAKVTIEFKESVVGSKVGHFVVGPNERVGKFDIALRRVTE